MEKQSLICTWKTSFYTDNITSNTHDSCIFDQLIANVCPVCTSDVLKTRKLWTTEKRQHCFGIIGNVACVPIHAFALQINTRFFFSEVLHEIWRIFPRSFDIVVISDVPTRYLIFCTKQTRKQSLFYRPQPERHMTFPECLYSPGRMACLFGNTERCVVVSFSGPT